MDCTGGENLLGKGDMLYLGNGSLKPIRIQSAYVDESTKNYLINKLRNARVIKSEPKVEVAAPKTEPTPVTKPKRMGLFQTMKALMSVKPIMFQSDEYPHNI